MSFKKGAGGFGFGVGCNPLVRFEPSDITPEMLDGAKANGCVFVDISWVTLLS